MPETGRIISEKYARMTRQREPKMSLVGRHASSFDKAGVVTGKRTLFSDPVGAEKDLSAVDQTSYLRTRREKGSRAFHLEYDTAPTKQEIARELRSYLAEYRLTIPEYSYELFFGRGVGGDNELRLRNIDRGEPLGNKTKRVIEERKLWLEPTEREKAEDKAIAILDAKLRSIKTGDTVIWASPPGPKEQGYGDYGFLFVGQATKADPSSSDAHLAMTAIRIENPKRIDEIRQEGKKPSDLWVTQVNNTLSTLIGTQVAFQTREDALGQPFVVGKTLSQAEIHHSIKDNFNFEFDKDAQARSEAIIAQMDPLIHDATLTMQLGTKDQKQTILWALENYALKLKGDVSTMREGEQVIYMRIGKQRSLGDIVDNYGGYKPPKVRGSCGTSSNPSDKAGDAISSTGECRSIKCGGKDAEGHSCSWEASSDEAKAVQNGLLTTCPKCGWAP